MEVRVGAHQQPERTKMVVQTPSRPSNSDDNLLLPPRKLDPHLSQKPRSVSHPDHGEGVSPTCPIGGLPGSDCAPKSQPTQRQGQGSSVSGEDSCVQRHPENLAHASPQPFVVPHSKSLRECRSDDSDLVVGPATCTVKEQSPRAQNSIQVGCNEVWVTN